MWGNWSSWSLRSRVSHVHHKPLLLHIVSCDSGDPPEAKPQSYPLPFPPYGQGFDDLVSQNSWTKKHVAFSELP